MSSSRESSKLRRKEREWKPTLKGVKSRPKAQETASGSALAAQRAMANIKDLNRRRDRGQEVDSVILAKISQSLDTKLETKSDTQLDGQPAKTAKPQHGKQASQTPSKSSRRQLFVGLSCGGCLLLVAAAVLAFGSSRYSVAGTMLLEQRPLAGVELQFHASNGNFTASRVTTSDKGDFSIGGLPAGIYRVTLQPDSQSSVNVPLAYKSLDSTPLRMKVQRNMTNVSLLALQPKRR
jgi:hypothetical protein